MNTGSSHLSEEMEVPGRQCHVANVATRHSIFLFNGKAYSALFKLLRARRKTCTVASRNIYEADLVAFSTSTYKVEFLPPKQSLYLQSSAATYKSSTATYKSSAATYKVAPLV